MSAPYSEHPAQDQRPALGNEIRYPQRAIVIARVWVLVALGLTILMSIGRLRHTFVEEQPHGWACAHLAVMAHSLVVNGIIPLHGVPIQNEGVLGIHPDIYSHWPPLYAICLSFIERIFGDSEAVIFACGAATALAFAAGWYWLMSMAGGKLRALTGTFALLTLPIFVDRAHIWTVSACYALMLVSLCLAMAVWEDKRPRRLNLFIACLGIICGVLVSWEAVLMAPGLLLAALLLREKKLARIALVVGIAAALACAMFLLVCIGASPDLRTEFVATFKYRTGSHYAAGLSLNSIADTMLYNTQPSAWDFLQKAFERLEAFGILGIASVFVFGWRVWKGRKNKKERKLFVLFATFAFVFIAWFSVFPNHIYMHDYQWLLLAPLAAMGIGELLQWIWLKPETLFSSVAVRVFGLLLPAFLILPLASTAIFMLIRHPKEEPWLISYAQDVRQNTPANAVIGSPELTLEVPYYAQRHIVRGIQSDELVALLREHADEFPESPVMVAIPRGEIASFPCTLAAFPHTELKSGILLNLKDNPNSSLDGANCTTMHRLGAVGSPKASGLENDVSEERRLAGLATRRDAPALFTSR